MRREIRRGKWLGKDYRHQQLDNISHVKEKMQRAHGSANSLISPQRTEVGPPLGNASDKLAASAVQEFRIAKARPNIARGEKFLFNSLLWPRAANWAASGSFSGW